MISLKSVTSLMLYSFIENTIQGSQIEMVQGERAVVEFEIHGGYG